MLSIQTNIASLDAQRNLDKTQTSLNSSLQQLSSGYRINTAADDAAGLAVSNNLQSQVNGLNQATQNANDGIDMLQASNGTLSAADLSSINTELGQLTSQVNAISTQTQYNGKTLLSGSLTTQQVVAEGATNTVTAGQTFDTTGGNATIAGVDVTSAQSGATYTLSSGAAGTLTLTNGTTNVSQTINVSAIAANGTEALNFSQVGVNISVSSDSGGKTAAGLVTDMTGGKVSTQAGTGAVNLQVGANASDSMSVSFGELDIQAGVGPMQGLSSALSTFSTDVGANAASSVLTTDAQNLITQVDAGINSVNTVNATLGAQQNRLQVTVANLQTSSQNLAASNSDIKDTDVAATTAEMTAANIQMQAGISVLAQANQLPQLALKLLG